MMLAVGTAGLLAGCAGAPPQITSLSPSNGSRGVAADEPVRITFDHGVEPSSVASRLRIDPGLAGCDLEAAFSARADAPCRVTWSADDSSLVLLHPGALFLPDLTYHLHLDAGIRDRQGVVNDLDHSWQLNTGSAPVVRSTVPVDGATGVAVEGPLSITFSSAMAVTATQASIRLTPDVAGTRIVVSSVDHSQYVIFPGRLLQPETRYTLTVGVGAADEHGQPLAQPVQAAFTSAGPGAGLGGGSHAVVLARADGELPSVVVLTGDGPAQPGEPTPAVTLLTAPRCLSPGCPAVGGPAVGYVEAALSPAADRVALIERDSLGATPDQLVLVDLPTLVTTVVATGASHPAWSADGHTLAYGLGGAVELYSPATAARTRLPAGDPLDAPPVWSPDGSALALPVRHPGQAPHIDLADPVLLARYPVPGVGLGAGSPAFSPSGDTLAVRLDAPQPAAGRAAGTWLVRLRDGAPLQRLSATLTPLAWADAGTLLGIDRGPGGAALVRVAVAGGDSVALSAGPRDSDLATVVADAAGRRIGFLRPDDAGHLQAWAMNDDGSNPTPLTSLSGGAGLDAVSVALGG